MEQTKQVSQKQDPSVIAHRLATEALREEDVRRKSLRRKVDGAVKAKKDAESGTVLLEDGRRVTPMAAFMQTSSTDFTVIPDELIKRTEPYGKWHVRWISTVDQFGNQNDAEMNYYKRFGYEAIFGKDGNPANRHETNQFKTRELMAMQGPPEGFAAHLARSARPGSDLYDTAFEEMEDDIAQVNKRRGYRAVELVTSGEHGYEDPRHVSFSR